MEVQVLGDGQGSVVHVFERECSVQRRFQKIVEETPSPALDAALREKICETAAGIARSIGYRNAGTVEFIFGDRKSVVQGKSVSVRVDLGGRRIIKKKNKKRSDTSKKYL